MQQKCTHVSLEKLAWPPRKFWAASGPAVSHIKQPSHRIVCSSPCQVIAHITERHQRHCHCSCHVSQTVAQSNSQGGHRTVSDVDHFTKPCFNCIPDTPSDQDVDRASEVEDPVPVQEA